MRLNNYEYIHSKWNACDHRDEINRASQITYNYMNICNKHAYKHIGYTYLIIIFLFSSTSYTKITNKQQ